MQRCAVNKDFPSLTETFLNYFDVDLATTKEQKDQVARLRYRVYCDEFAYESAKEFPDLRELDEFDQHSLHCLVTHRRSGRPAGCVRLVCASDEHAMPVETHCLQHVYAEYTDSLRSDRSRVCEFSRLAVDATFRKRPGEENTLLGELDALDCSHQEQRTFSIVGIACFLSAFALAELAGRDQIYAMMEANLPRLLRRAGILVQQAGDFTDYHGQRAPFFITTDLALENMRDDLHGLYDSLYQRLAHHYRDRARINFA